MGSLYLTLKSLHVLGVVLFLGNIIVTGWWKVMADRTKHPVVIAFAQRQVTLTDWIFTAGGAAILFGAGLANVLIHDMDFLRIRWMAWGYWLFVASGVIWGAILIPIQIKQARMARLFEDGGTIPASYWRLCRIWNIFGVIANLFPLAIIYLMVSKPN